MAEDHTHVILQPNADLLSAMRESMHTDRSKSPNRVRLCPVGNYDADSASGVRAQTLPDRSSQMQSIGEKESEHKYTRLDSGKSTA